MNKAFLQILVVGLLLSVINTSYTIGATIDLYQVKEINRTQIQKIGNGVIRGTVTNQNGNPISFVRVSAFGEKSENGREYGFAITHLLINGKGKYTMKVEPGRYLFIRAAKLPLYIGAWAGPVYVNDGETVTIDLSITYVGPEIVSMSSPIYHSKVNTNNFAVSPLNYHTVINSLKNLFFLF